MPPVRRRCGAPTGKSLDLFQVALLQLWVVKIVEVVKRPDAMAVAEEAFANVRADEARAASDEKIHGGKLTSGGRSVERRSSSFGVRRPDAALLNATCRVRTKARTCLRAAMSGVKAWLALRLFLIFSYYQEKNLPNPNREQIPPEHGQLNQIGAQ